MWSRFHTATALLAGTALAVLLLVSLSQAAACDETWASTSTSGAWSTAGNWSPASVPTGTQNVCLPAGSYVVTLTGSQAANSITVGSGVTLAVTITGSSGALLTLSSNGSSDNSGEIELTDADSTGTGSPTAKIDLQSGATLTNDGTILSDPGPGSLGNRVIDGDGTNSGTLANASDGTITVNQDLAIDDSQAGAFTTAGTITIANGKKLLYAPSGSVLGAVYSPTMSITGGTITINGSFDNGISEAGGHASGGELNISGGTLTGAGLLSVDGAPAIFSGSGSGTYTFTGSNSANATNLSGTIPSGTTVALSGNAALGSAVAFIPSDTTNNGTIKLTDSDASAGGNNGAKILIGTGFTLTNHGTILSDPGAGSQGFRVIDGQSTNSGTLDNASDGTITVNHDLQIDDAQAGVFTTAGTINISSGKQFLLAPNGGSSSGTPAVFTPTVNITGGTITDNGTFGYGLSEGGSHFSPGALNVSGGTLTGAGLLSVDGAPAIFSGSGSGTYTFTGSNSANATNLSGTIPSGTTVALSGNAALGSAVAFIPSDTTNNGTIKLTDSDPSAGGNNGAKILIGTGFTLTNHGTILSDPGAGSQGFRVIDGNGFNSGTLDNASDGTITVNQDLQIDDAQAGVFTTAGTIDIPSGKQLLFAPAGGFCCQSGIYTPTMNITGGTITNHGTFASGVSVAGNHAGSGNVNISGATLTGGMTIDDGGPISFGGAGSGTYTVVGTSSAASSTLTGTIAANQTLILSAGSGLGGVPVTSAGDVTNNGTLEFTDPDGASAGQQGVSLRMVAPNTFTNNGTFITDPGGAGRGSYSLDGNITNSSTGTIDINQTLATDTQHTIASSVQTSGALNVASGQSLFVNTAGNGTVLTISGGTVSDSGHIYTNISPSGLVALTSGALVVDGGTATGNPVVAGNAGGSFAGSGHGTFTLVGPQSGLSGNIGAGCTVVVSGSSTGAGNTVVTAATGLTNAGTLELTDPDPSGSPTASAQLVVQSGTLSNAGTILSDPGPAGLGTQSIQAAITNSGTVSVNQTLAQSGGQFANQGTVAVAHGQQFSVTGSFPQSAGETSVAAGGTLTAPGGVNLQGGTLSGAGTVAGNVDNAGEVSPAPSPAKLTVSGTYTQESGGFLTGVATPTGADQLSVSGTATVNGTLAMSNASGFSPAVGQQYTVLKASSVSGHFAAVTGPYSATYNPGDVTVTATQPIGPSLSIANASVDEPAYGTAPANFTVTLSAAQSSPVTVDYATANGTAIAGQDYMATSGKLTFAPGQTSQTIPVSVVGGVAGPTATFHVDLSNPSGASLTNNRATGTIVRKPPSVGGAVDPSSGGAGGTVTVTIAGTGLFGTPSVELIAPGAPTITATDVTVAGDGTTLTATFSLAGATLGPRSVAIVDGAASRTIPNGFTIVPAVLPQISVQIAGPSRIGPNTHWNGELLYHNAGNIDAYATQFEITGFPEGTDVTVTGATGPSGGTDLGGIRAILIALGKIPASSSGVIGITFTAPPGRLGKFAYLQPAVVSTSADPSNAPDPSARNTAQLTKHTADELAGTVTVSSPDGPIPVNMDLKLVPAPSDGQPSVTTTTSGGMTTVTELLPPPPPPADFTAGPGACLTANLITVGGGAGAVATAPLAGCGGSGFATVVVRAAGDVGSGVARPADLPNPNPGGPSWGQLTWSVATGQFGPLGKTAGAASTYSAAQAQTNLLDFDHCLQAAGLISPSQANQLDDSTRGPFILTLLGELGNLAGGPAGGKVASVAETLIGSQLDRAWAGAVYSQLNMSSAGASVLPTDPSTGFPLPYSSANVLALWNNLLSNQAFIDCWKHRHPCKAGDLTGTPSQPPGPIIPNFCPNPDPPPPDPFPVQMSASLDPNDMVGPPGPGTKHWVAGTGRSPYTYTATFQNEPSATAPAYRVVVSDALNRSRFNLSTLSLGPVRVGSHLVSPPPGLQSWSTRIDLRPAHNAFVDVAGALNVTTGVVTWTFTTIDASTGQPVTDAINGFLPPDRTPPDGEGSVTFTVTPKPGLRTGTTLGNLATIVFDTNKPLSTPTWINAVDLTHPTSRVVTVRASRRTVRYAVRVGRRSVIRRVHVIDLTWRGSDRLSGIAGFELYGASGRAGFTRLTGLTSATRARFICTAGRSYRFATVAVSRVGIVQVGRSRPSRAMICR